MKNFKVGNVVAVTGDYLCTVVGVFNDWLLIEPFDKSPAFGVWSWEVWPILDAMP